MKKVFLSICAVAAMIACNKNDVTPMQPANESSVITFGVAELLATKAVSESTGATVQATGFNVAGITSDDVTYFNELASFVSGTSYKTATQYYYPTGKTLDFYACHPVNNEITITNAAASVSYTHSKYEDLIVAMAQNVSSQAGDVALTFDHILSQLIFTAKGSDTNADYVLKSITVKAPNGGTYTFADGKWSRGTLADEAYWATDLAVSTSTATTVNESMTFLPGEIQVTASWECYVDGQLVASYTKSTPAVGQANAIVLDKGKKNTVNLTLPNASAVGISFSVTVNPWGSTSQDVTLE